MREFVNSTDKPSREIGLLAGSTPVVVIGEKVLEPIHGNYDLASWDDFEQGAGFFGFGRMLEVWNETLFVPRDMNIVSWRKESSSSL